MEENTNTNTNTFLKLIASIARYILGLLLLTSGPLTLFLFHKDPMIMTHAITHPMLTFFVTPQIIIGLYFMFTGKWRLRVDFTLLLIAVGLIYAFTTFFTSFNA
jgi:hypothetical protein